MTENTEKPPPEPTKEEPEPPKPRIGFDDEEPAGRAVKMLHDLIQKHPAKYVGFVMLSDDGMHAYSSGAVSPALGMQVILGYSRLSGDLAGKILKTKGMLHESTEE